MSAKSNRRKREEDRPLRRDEVFVPDVYTGFLGEWKRDQAYIQYLLLKRTGWVGRIVVLIVLVLGTAYAVFTALTDLFS